MCSLLSFLEAKLSDGFFSMEGAILEVYCAVRLLKWCSQVGVCCLLIPWLSTFSFQNILTIPVTNFSFEALRKYCLDLSEPYL